MAATVLLRRVLDLVMGADTPFVVLLFIPVVLTAWAAGVGPALLCAALAVVFGDQVSMDPSVPLAARVIRIGTFMLEALLVASLLKAGRRGARKRAEIELRYRTLAENFPNGAVVLFDRDMRYLVAAGKGLSEVGLSGPTMIGRTPREVLPKEVSAQIEPLFRAALAGHENVAEVAYLDKMRLVHCVPVRDASGRVVSGMLMTQDVTQQRKLEEQLRQAQKLDAVGRLAGGVAHDFNNLLTVIRGRCDLILARSKDGPLTRDLGAIAEAAARASDLTRQLLAFSRRQTLDTQIIDLNQALREMKPILEGVLKADIQLVLDLHEQPLHLRINRGQLDQILMNLCVNARDAISGAGEIRVSTRDVREESGNPGRLFEIPPGHYVLLRVSDTGCGMDGVTLQHLFDPFFSTKGSGKGTGLGLSIVHGIVGQNHGHIDVTSELGRGSVFSLYWPAVQAIPEFAPALPPTTATEGRGRVVLVVEDEDPVRELVVDLLSSSGFRVHSACDAEQGLVMAHRHPEIDVLVTDMVLPKMSGFELCQRMRQELPHVRTLLVSGYAGDLVGLENLTQNGTAFLPKPFTPPVLLRCIERLLATTEQGPTDSPALS